ncbi:MAG: bis(5'-nucleosyl)-tetraphosphatase (symmetrical) YqeK [Lachnospiraceae bacterium]|uniref:bis(5'-nucleosyl)-tetraphosphatase (symmetrical) YqeK n=1 Tax=Parablautia sp. Marseille-Q6255 TaxID=3039593 RepID=UPI0024BC59FA|nr:bis(5'-nucleosyl)-tetraphosphatase (symmetrical) YqeK [Parablautia sp. Marseille-Q6255]
MDGYNILKMQKKLKKYMDEMRFWHTLGVMYTAASLAMRYGEDIEKAQVAGLLHDCAKCIPNEKKLKLCRQNHIPVSETEQNAPFLLHARLGAYIAAKKYDITDPEILSAIEFHTTGRPQMTLLEKIIFTADYIEPMRNKAAGLDAIRRMAFEDIDCAVYTILKDTLTFLEKEKTCLDNQTVIAYNYYKKLMEKTEV